MAQRHQIWLIDEGNGGHRVQSEGVLSALRASGLEMDVSYIRCNPKIRGFFRPIARSLFYRLSRKSALPLARAVADFSLPATHEPSFIISSGGRTAFLSRALSLWSGAPNVFIGNPKPFPASWFRAILSPVPLATARTAILTEIVPNNVTPAICRAKAEEFWQGEIPRNCWTMLIGGANRNHLFRQQDWEDIARAMNALAERHGIKWLAATSRRTSAAAEAILRSTLIPEAVHSLVLHSEDARPVVLPFLGAGEIVYVTQDSLTMLSEAISSGKPVVSISPQHIDLHPDNFMAVILRNYHSFAQFTGVQAAEMAAVPLKNGPIEYPLSEIAMARACGQLRAELGI